MDWSRKLMEASLELPEGEMRAPKVLYVLVASILGTFIGSLSYPAVRFSSPGAVSMVDKVAMPFFHFHDIKNQKLFNKLIPPPVLNKSLSHS